MSAEDEVVDTQIEPTEEVVKTDEAEDASTQEAFKGEPEYTEHEKKMFERAKKAEAEAKKLKAELARKPQTAEKQVGEVSLKDQYALLEAKVPADDIDEVINYAKFKGISVSEALKSSVIKATLSEKAEQRKTSEVTNTAGSRRTTVKMTDEMIVQNAAEGKSFDPEALALARINLKKKK